ncbi:hypothetical protein [Microtetraspora malaysiensis]|uniref:hypothetical protein n=1 Tax=Microtetraspora malaysiensis TaxID=161358 RepID=UPI00082A2132|nr:hypothetical protein [Microtetraspora malaysiensis]
MSPSDLPGPYHGIHPAPPQAGWEKVAWQECFSRATRIRVHEHTCECKKIVYELCQAGGLIFVRRLYRASDGTAVLETEWLRPALARQLWMRILLGQMR